MRKPSNSSLEFDRLKVEQAAQLALLEVRTLYDSIEITDDRAMANFHARYERGNSLVAFLQTLLEGLAALLPLRSISDDLIVAPGMYWSCNIFQIQTKITSQGQISLPAATSNSSDSVHHALFANNVPTGSPVRTSTELKKGIPQYMQRRNAGR